METIVNIEARIEAKELKITPPEGYEVDKENSTFDCIKFKPINKRWRDNTEANISGWYMLTSTSKIYQCETVRNTPNNYCLFATEKYAKSALAMARISQIMANDERFGGVVTDEEWKDDNMSKYCILRRGNEIFRDFFMFSFYFLAFHTAEQRELFLKENEDLVKDYLMLGK